MLAVLLALGWVVFDVRQVYRLYQSDDPFMMGLGLTGLGAINTISGTALLFAQTGLSPIVVTTGMASSIVGAMLIALAETHILILANFAPRIGYMVFVIGLFVLVEQG